MVASMGERRSMILAGLTTCVAYVAAELTGSLLLLALAMIVVGAMTSVYGLARHGWLAEHVPFAQRARALSLMGGIFRGGMLVGPLLGSLIIYLSGVQTVYYVAVVTTLLSAVVLFLSPRDAASDATEVDKISTFKVAMDNRGKLFTAGLSAAIVSVMRTVRSLGLPLWGLYIGMHPGTTSLIIGITGAIDFALFYVSGQIMDKYGRRAALVPTLVGLSVGIFSLTLASNDFGFVVVALVLSLANATGSGLVLTIGADLAPPGERNEFLAAFRLMIDSATAATPILLGAMKATILLPGSMVVFAAIGLAGAGLGYWSLPRHGIK
jgi:MFS family permease